MSVHTCCVTGDAYSVAREVVDRVGTDLPIPDFYTVPGPALIHLVADLMGALMTMQSMAGNLNQSAELFARLARGLGAPAVTEAAAVLQQIATIRTNLVAHLVVTYPKADRDQLDRLYGVAHAGYAQEAPR